MPKAFEQCVASGGRVWTERLGGRKYVHKCSKGGKTYSGHVKTRKKTLATK